jgi:hypothetical protein
LLAADRYRSKELQMMGFFDTPQAQSEPDGGGSTSPGTGITADVDVNVSLPSVDADVRIDLPSVDADVSFLAGDCDNSGVDAQINVVTPDTLLDIHAPGLLDVTLGTDNGASDCSDAIHVEALNGDHLLEVHAPGLLDATIGGAELGQIVGGSDCGSGGSNGDGIQVELLNGEHIAEVHVPSVADVTVGGETGGLLHGLDDIGGC